jgi:hypothetical protein
MACPVCFGDSHEPMALATNYGIWFMLGIVAVMLSAFATFFIHLMRRARLAAQPPPSVDGGSYIRGQEGTA